MFLPLEMVKTKMKPKVRVGSRKVKKRKLRTVGEKKT